MSVSPGRFLEAFGAAGVDFATGVPDSLLKEVCACITATLPEQRHVVAPNEGSAAGVAIGHYLATGRPALVYLQNSGLGNLVNPVASLADPLVCGIPMILLVGWRGEIAADGTQLHDEPQHVLQGRVTTGQLDLLGIEWRVVDRDTTDDDLDAIARDVVRASRARMGPAALVVRKGAFSTFDAQRRAERADLPSREEALRHVVAALPGDTPIVATTGMASRELFELRRAAGRPHDGDFLCVGGMGHASQIACGIAFTRPGRKVVCVDGDGAIAMHMGALTVGARCSGLVHVVVNNAAHDSVGGQPTAAGELDLSAIAGACGYGRHERVGDAARIGSAIDAAMAERGSAFVEILCRRGARADLGRPDRTPQRNRDDFMAFLARTTS